MTTVLILLSTILSAFNNNIICLKLKDCDPIGLILALNVCMLPYTLLRCFQVGWSNIKFPEGNQILFVALCSLIYFVTDLCYFGAYNKGASIATMTTACSLFPTLAIGIHCLWMQVAPTYNQLFSCLLAAVAIKLASE